MPGKNKHLLSVEFNVLHSNGVVEEGRQRSLFLSISSEHAKKDGPVLKRAAQKELRKIHLSENPTHFLMEDPKVRITSIKDII